MLIARFRHEWFHLTWTWEILFYFFQWKSLPMLSENQSAKTNKMNLWIKSERRRTPFHLKRRRWISPRSGGETNWVGGGRRGEESSGTWIGRREIFQRRRERRRRRRRCNRRRCIEPPCVCLATRRRRSGEGEGAPRTAEESGNRSTPWLLQEREWERWILWRVCVWFSLWRVREGGRESSCRGHFGHFAHKISNIYISLGFYFYSYLSFFKKIG